MSVTNSKRAEASQRMASPVTTDGGSSFAAAMQRATENFPDARQARRSDGNALDRLHRMETKLAPLEARLDLLQALRNLPADKNARWVVHQAMTGHDMRLYELRKNLFDAQGTPYRALTPTEAADHAEAVVDEAEKTLRKLTRKLPSIKDEKYKALIRAALGGIDFRQLRFRPSPGGWNGNPAPALDPLAGFKIYAKQ